MATVPGQIGPYSSISLFTGAYGLDLGLERAGFQVKASVEKDPLAVGTIVLNRPMLQDKILQMDIRKVSVPGLLEKAGLSRGEACLVAGGPPCQPFSTAGRRGSVKSDEGLLFQSFLKVVWGIYPTFFLFENVKGILSSALFHRPLRLRKNERTPTGEKARLGSGWEMIRSEFEKTLRTGRDDGYKIFVWELNAADYGAAQTRKRVFIVGARGGYGLEIPKATHAGNHRTLREVIGHLDGSHEVVGVDYRPYDPDRLHVFGKGLVGPGENWEALNTYWRKKVMGHAYESWGGRVGFARRLSWGQPSPTITTNPRGRATTLCHPDKARPLTVTECALLQGFPENWRFAPEKPTRRYVQIGNAVTVQLAEAIGRELARSLSTGPTVFA